jgi:hypothetical protein
MSINLKGFDQLAIHKIVVGGQTTLSRESLFSLSVSVASFLKLFYADKIQKIIPKSYLEKFSDLQGTSFIR